MDNQVEKNAGGKRASFKFRYIVYVAVLIAAALIVPPQLRKRQAVQHYNKGVALANENKNAAAFEEFKKAFSYNPQLPDLKQALLDTTERYASELESHGDFLGACEVFKETRDLVHDDPDLLISYARVCIFGEKLDEAEKALKDAEQVIKKAPEKSMLKAKMVAALKWQIKLQRKRQLVAPLVEEAKKLLAANKPEEALAKLAEALKKYPTSSAAQKVVMMCYFKMLEDAKKAGDEAKFKKILADAIKAEARMPKETILESPTRVTVLARPSLNAPNFAMAVIAFRCRYEDKARDYCRKSIEMNEKTSSVGGAKDLLKELTGRYQGREKATKRTKALSPAGASEGKPKPETP